MTEPPINPSDACDSCLQGLAARQELKRVWAIGASDIYLYFKGIQMQRAESSQPDYKSMRRMLDAVYIKPKVEGKQEIRKLWAETLGIDLWYPYFKVREVEKRMKKKLSFKIFRMKCTPRFEKDSFTYICRRIF